MDIDLTEIIVAVIALLSGIAGKISWDRWIRKDKQLSKISDLLEDKFELQMKVDKHLDRNDEQRAEYEKKVAEIQDLISVLGLKYQTVKRNNANLKRMLDECRDNRKAGKPE